MTREEYERNLCARNGTASFVSVKHDAGFDGWEPEVGGCHGNVYYWVKHHVGHTAVRGWSIYEWRARSYRLHGHSVVRAPDGQLFDITPLYHNNDPRGRFIVHVGDDATFLAMRTLNLNISCRGNCPAPPLDPIWALQQHAHVLEEEP